MKNKLRKIVIDQTIYVYTKTRHYLGNENTKFTFRIFKQGYKKTPIIIEFICQEDYIAGNPLNNGVMLFNSYSNQLEKINLNHPKTVQALILIAINKGWTGENSLPIQNGRTYLEEMGLTINDLP